MMLITQSVWGALSACYPSKPRIDLLAYARNIFGKVNNQNDVDDNDVLLRMNVKASQCHDRDPTSPAELEGKHFFHKTFTTAQDSVIQDKDSVPHSMYLHLTIEDMVCQMDCLRHVDPLMTGL